MHVAAGDGRANTLLTLLAWGATSNERTNDGYLETIFIFYIFIFVDKCVYKLNKFAATVRRRCIMQLAITVRICAN